MANRKEYEMLFRLGAQMNGEFTRTFLLRRRKLALRRTESSGKFAIHLRTESK